ncbi:MAG: ATP-dependent DNA helicase RecG, partial [Lachnospiraceae bacterium]|nr:ATP-dependent DNA helicase RecG [Lachnospiraceae bacterium]
MSKDSLRELKGIGEKTEKLFERVGVGTLNQLLHYYPREYDSFEKAVPLGQVRINEKQAVYGTITKAPSVSGGGAKAVTVLNLEDATGQLQIIWFHMPFLRSTLKRGSRFVFRGKVILKNNRRLMEHPEIYSMAAYEGMQGKMLPVYALTSGLTNKAVCKAVTQLLSQRALEKEYLPFEIRERLGLADINFAINSIHFPENEEALLEARSRLVFDEFFFFMLTLARMKEHGVQQENHFPAKAVWKTEEVIENLPYRLTRGQMQVWNELENDLKGSSLMNRLIQGDVGSGKTILAFLAMIMMWENGYQSALMVPTEVLANQHYEALLKLLEENGLTDVHPVLLKGSCTPKEKREINEKIACGYAGMIIGTHALIQQTVQYKNLGLVITDEQHRFGVRQRNMLSEKGYPPNVLVMSATPIPRTLAIILYGDLDISILDELPARRKPIKNCVVGTSYRPNAYRFMQKEIQAGHQVYVICPMVEPNEEIACENVLEYSERLKKHFPKEVGIALLHGRMKAAEKDAVMKAFAENEIQILVSTTVVEVGVNVPNATVMMIENAERFGLAQLHQLRGRVGRGDAQSYCIFMQGDEKE